MNTSLQQVTAGLINGGSAGVSAFQSLSNAIAQSEIPVRKMNSTLKNWMTTLKNTIKWEASSTLVHGIEGAFTSAISYAKNLNSTLNDIRIVTNATTADMTKFATQANKYAKELSTTTNDFAKASLIYYQQGDNADLAAKKAIITTKAANVAFTASAQEMSQMLTAVWNSYQAGEDQLEHMVDVMAKLGATTASSMEEMSKGMQKVAATANTVGVSMEKMSAMIATSASVTRQAPETIGTAWNTVLSRLGGLKLGETLEDGVDLNKYSKVLKTVGVDILDATGNIRDMGDVIDEIGAKWDIMTKAQKSALAQTVGGARQYTQILAFFENFDKYQKNLAMAQNANGALNQQQEIYAQSWEAASKRSQAALEELYSVLINDKGITKLTNSLTGLVEKITAITKGFGGLPGILMTLGNVANKVFDQQIYGGIAKVVTGISGFGKNLGADLVAATRKNKGQDEETGAGSNRATFLGRFTEIRAQRGSSEQREAYATLQQARNAISVENLGEIGDNKTQNIIDNTNELLNLKQRLMNAEHNLSDVEIARAQAAIDNLTQEQQKVADLYGEYEKLESSIKSNAAKVTSGGKALTGEQTAEYRNYLRQRMGKGSLDWLTTEHDQSPSVYQRATMISNRESLNGSRAGEARRQFTINSSAIAEAASNMSYGAKEADGELFEVKQAAQELQTTLKQINETPVDVEIDDETIQKVNDLLQKIKEKSQIEITAKVTVDDDSVGDNAEAEGYATGGNLLYRTAQQERNAKDASTQANKILDNTNSKINTVAKGIQTFTKSIMAAGAAFVTTTNMMDTFYDEAASGTQKISALVSAGTNLVSAWSQGIVSGVIATVASAASLLISSSQHALQQAKEYRIQIGEQVTASINKVKETYESQEELYTEYINLKQAMEDSELTHQEYIDKLSSVADSIDIEGAHVLALKGNYEALAQAIENANGKRLAATAGEAEIAYNKSVTQMGYMAESNWHGSSSFQRNGNQIMLKDFLDNIDKLQNNPMWQSLTNFNDGYFSNARQTFGITNSMDSKEILAQVLGGSVGGTIGNWWYDLWDNNSNNFTFEDSAENYFTFYDRFQELDELMLNGTEDIKQLIGAILSIPDVSAFRQMIEDTVNPVIEARDLMENAKGKTLLANSYSKDNVQSRLNQKEDIFNIEDEMVQALLEAWDIDQNNSRYESAKQAAYKLAQSHLEAVTDGFEIALETRDAKTAIIEKIKATAEERGNVISDAIVDSLMQLSLEELQNVNPDILNYSDSGAKLKEDIASIGGGSAALNAYQQAQALLMSAASGDYDLDNLLTSFNDLASMTDSVEQIDLSELKTVDDKRKALQTFINETTEALQTLYSDASEGLSKTTSILKIRADQMTKEIEQWKKDNQFDPQTDIETIKKNFDALSWLRNLNLNDTTYSVNDSDNVSILLNLLKGASLQLNDWTRGDNETLAEALGIGAYTNNETGITTYNGYQSILEALNIEFKADAIESGIIDWQKLLEAMIATPDGQKYVFQLLNYAFGNSAASNITSLYSADKEVSLSGIESKSRGITAAQAQISTAEESLTTVDDVNFNTSITKLERLNTLLSNLNPDSWDKAKLKNALTDLGSTMEEWINLTDLEKKEQVLKLIKQEYESIANNANYNSKDKALQSRKIALAEIEVLTSKINLNQSNMSQLTIHDNGYNAYYQERITLFDQLIAKYKDLNDVVNANSIKDQKKSFIQQYQDAYMAEAENIYNVLKNFQNKISSATSSGGGILDDIIGGKDISDLGYEKIQSLKEALMELGYTADEANEKIANIGKQDYESEEQIFEATKLKIEMLLAQAGSVQMEHEQVHSLNENSTVNIQSIIDTPYLILNDDKTAVKPNTENADASVNVSDENQTNALDNTTGTYKPNTDNSDATVNIGESQDTPHLTGDTKLTPNVSTTAAEVSVIVKDKEDVTYVKWENNKYYPLAADGTSTININDNNVTNFLKDPSTPGGKPTLVEPEAGIASYNISVGGSNSNAFNVTGQTINVEQLPDGSVDYAIAVKNKYGESTGASLSVNSETGAVTLKQTNGDGIYTVGLQPGTFNGISVATNGDITFTGLSEEAKKTLMTVGATAGSGFTNGSTEGTLILNAPQQPTTKPTMDVDVNYTPNGTEPPADGEERIISVIVKYEDPNRLSRVLKRREFTENNRDISKSFFDTQMDSWSTLVLGSSSADSDWGKKILAPIKQTKKILEDMADMYDGDMLKFTELTNYDQNQIESTLKEAGLQLERAWENLLEQYGGNVTEAWVAAQQDEIFMAGYNLYTGLIDGYYAAYGSYGSIVANVSTDLLQYIKETLGEHSPSIYTYEMGKYLMEGLSNGFNETEFKVDGLRKTVLEKIKNELSDLSSANQLRLIESEVFGINSYGLNQSKAEQQLNQKGYGIYKNSEGKYQVHQGQLQEDGIFKFNTNAYINKVFESFEEAYLAAITTLFSEERLTEMFTGGYKTSSELNGIQKKIIEKALEQVLSDYNTKNGRSVIDIANLIDTEGINTVYELFQIAIDNINEDVLKAASQVWSKIKQSVSEGLTSVEVLHADSAKKVYEAWTKQFSAIADAWKAIWADQSLYEGLSDASRNTLISMWNSKNIQPSEIMNKIFGQEKVTAQDLTLSGNYFENVVPNIEYGNAFTYTPSGLLADGDANKYETVQNRVKEQAKTFANSRIDKLLPNISDYAEMLNKAPTAEEYAAQKNLEEGSKEFKNAIAEFNEALGALQLGLVKKNDKSGQYEADRETAKDTFVQDYAEEAAKAFTEQVYTATKDQLLQEYVTAIVNMQTLAEAQYGGQRDKALSDQELVQKAIDEGVENLTKADQKALLKLFPEGTTLTDLMGEDGLNRLKDKNYELASAADAAATALATLTNAIITGAISKDAKGNWINTAQPGQLANDGRTYTTFEDAQEAASQLSTDISEGARIEPCEDGYIIKLYPRIQDSDLLDENNPLHQNGDTDYAAQAIESNSEALGKNQQRSLNLLGTMDKQLNSLESFQEGDLANTIEGLQAFGSTLDITNANLMAFYTNLQEAFASGNPELIASAIDQMTTAILRQGEGLIFDSPLAKDYYQRWKDNLEITDQNGQAFTAETLNMLRSAEALRDLNEILEDMNQISKKVTKTNGKYADSFMDLYKDLRKTGKEFDKYIDDQKNLSKADKKALKEINKLAASYKKLAKELGKTEDEADDFVEALLNSKDAGEVAQKAMKEVADVMRQSGKELSADDGQWANIFQNWEQNLGENADEFVATATQMLEGTGLELTNVMDYVMNMIAEAGYKLEDVDWGEITNKLHVDVSFILALLQAYLAYLMGLDSLDLPVPDAAELIAKVQEAIGMTEAFQASEYGMGGGAKNGKGGGGGGGGGGKKGEEAKTHDEKDPEEEKERYHQIERAISKQNELLEINNELKDRAYGDTYIKYLEEENRQLEKQVSLNREKQKEAEEYYKKDKARLEEFGATFDEMGNLNYEEYMNKWITWYNQMAATPMVDEAWKKIEEQYDKAMKAIENYEDSEDKLLEVQKEILSLQNKISDNLIEAITTKFEVEVKINDNDKKYLDALIKRFENTFDKQSDIFEWNISKFNLTADNFKLAQDAVAALMKETNFTVDANGNVNFEDLINNNKYTLTEGLLNSSKITQKGFEETIQEQYDNVMDYIDEMIDLRNELNEFYSNTLDKGEEKLSKLTNSLDHFGEMIDKYKEMLDFTEPANSFAKFEKVNELLGRKYTTYMSKIVGKQNELENWKKQLDILTGEISGAADVKDENGDIIGYKEFKINMSTEAAEQAIDTLKEKIEELEEDLADDVVSLMQLVQESYENAIEWIYEGLNRAASKSGQTLDDLIQKWDWWKEEQDVYVDRITEVYEINKLTRKIELDISNTRTNLYKTELVALKEKIQLQSKNNQLTQFNIDMLNYEYQLLLAKQALEDARNNKDIVKLTRDSNGNYGYQYTADQEEIAEAEQNLEDVLWEMNQAAKQRKLEAQSELLKLEQEMKQSMNEISKNEDNLSFEEVDRKLKQTFEHYNIQIKGESKDIQDADAAIKYTQEEFAKRYRDISLIDKEKLTSAELGALDERTYRQQDQLEYKLTEDLQDPEQFLKSMQESIQPTIEAIKNEQEAIKFAQEASGFTNEAIYGENGELVKYTEQSEVLLGDIKTEVYKITRQLENIANNFQDFNEAIDEVLKFASLLKDSIKIATELQEVPKAVEAETVEMTTQEVVITPLYPTKTPTEPSALKAQYQVVDKNTNKVLLTEWDESVWKLMNQHPELKGTDVYVINLSDEDETTDLINWSTGDSYHRSYGVSRATGGTISYTGLAHLDGAPGRPEYVLNQEDTAHMFDVVGAASQLDTDTISNIMGTLRMATATMLTGMNAALPYAENVSNGPNELQQNVHITAEFPNATDHNEIEMAFNDIINMATQYANR